MTDPGEKLPWRWRIRLAIPRVLVLAVLGLVVVAALSFGVYQSLTGPNGVDWSQFIPDLFSGVLVGGAVAGFVAVFVSRREQASASTHRANLAEGHWEMLAGRVRGLMPEDWNMRGNLDHVVRRADALVQSLDLAELTSILEDFAGLPEDKEAIDGLAYLVIDNAQLVERGQSVDRVLRAVLGGDDQWMPYGPNYRRALAKWLDFKLDEESENDNSDYQDVRATVAARVDLDGFLDLLLYYAEVWNRVRERLTDADLPGRWNA